MRNKIEKRVSHHNDTSAQPKEFNVDPNPDRTKLEQILREINYPASKKEIVRFLRDRGNTEPKILKGFEMWQDRQYNDAIEVITEFDLLKIAMNFKFKPHSCRGFKE